MCLSSLRLQVGNDEAVKFYEKFGFEVRQGEEEARQVQNLSVNGRALPNLVGSGDNTRLLQEAASA